jgi:hypothetical protein
MKKTNLVLLILLLNVSVFVSAQDTNTEVPQKPSKEDFYHTWVTERVEGKTKYFIENTFINESSMTNVITILRRKTIQNFTISSWEEVVNTYKDIEEYPDGFKISSKENKNGAVSITAMFINADKTKYLSVIDLGFYTQYDIFTKK